MSVVYEVNISVENVVLDQYLEWLWPHIDEPEQVPGVQTGSAVSKNLANSEASKTELCVHYKFDSVLSLQNYLDNQAKTLRAKLPESFEGMVSITRRHLETITRS